MTIADSHGHGKISIKRYIITYFSLLEFPRWDFTDAEIAVPSAEEDQEPSPVLSLKPAVDHNIASHVPLLPASLSHFRLLSIFFVER